MKIPRKAILASLTAVLSLSVASGIAWAQDARGNMKLNNKSNVETQPKSDNAGGSQMKMGDQAGGGMKTEDNTRMKGETGQMKTESGTRMKGEAGGRTKAEGTARMKGEGQNTEAGAKSDRKGQMKTEESGSMKKDNGSKAEMKSETYKSNKATSESNQTIKRNGESTKTGQSESSGTSNEKTGSVQKNGGVDVNVTSEQKTEIRQVIKTENIQPVEHVTFDVDVGTSIPHSVVLHPLPPRIVKIVPAYEDYEYFVLADGRIVIVDPDTYEIVYILV